jgi:hypothetical protein
MGPIGLAVSRTDAPQLRHRGCAASGSHRSPRPSSPVVGPLRRESVPTDQSERIVGADESGVPPLARRTPAPGARPPVRVDHPLRERKPHQIDPSSTEREARRHFHAAFDTSGQQEVGDVRARDQEYCSRDGEHATEDGPGDALKTGCTPVAATIRNVRASPNSGCCRSPPATAVNLVSALFGAALREIVPISLGRRSSI